MDDRNWGASFFNKSKNFVMSYWKKSVDTTEHDKSDAHIEENQGNSKEHICSAQWIPESKSPGKPTATGPVSNIINLTWTEPRTKDEVEYYEVLYRSETDTKWQRHRTESSKAGTSLELKEDSSYTFKVRAFFNEGESLFSPESHVIRTKKSVVREIARRAQLIQQKEGMPAIYQLPIQVIHYNTASKSRKCNIGNRKEIDIWPMTWIRNKLTQFRTNRGKEKTILIVGATGAGKSTLLDGMVNYLLGVNWHDDKRFTVIHHTEEEKKRAHDQTMSQTEWITCYNLIPSPTVNVEFSVVNIIDTPGFGDVRGIERDKKIVSQIKQFFSTICDKGGIECINAVCFVTQAPLARLTPTQRYIFDSILSVFGKNIKENILVLVTFADGKTPPVIEALNSAGVPYEDFFSFNNSALFEGNIEKEGAFSKFFWNMGTKSYKDFFNKINSMKSKSLVLTKEVLEEREKLELNVNTLLPAIDIGLNKLEEIRQHEVFVRMHEADIDAGRDFKTTATRIRERKEELPPGTHVTNCIHCHFTCHYPCYIARDDEKRSCAAMSMGICDYCPRNCNWDKHFNNGYRLIQYTETYTVTSKELKELYMKGKKQKKKTLSFLSCIKDEFRLIESNVASKITTIRKSLNRLNEIALKPDAITDVQYIDLLIESEKKQGKEGFHGRIQALEKLKKHAEITKEVATSQFKPFDWRERGKNVPNENTGDNSSVNSKEKELSSDLTTSVNSNLQTEDSENGISEEYDSDLSENTGD